MPKYRTRPGVELTSICGEYYLVSAREAMKDCPYITEINASSAFLWRRLAEGADKAALIAAVEDEFEVRDRAEAEAAIAGFIGQMLEMNYLLEEQGGTE